MNATEDLIWLDSPSSLQGSVDRLKAVKSLGMDAAIYFHGRAHRPMAKQLGKTARQNSYCQPLRTTPANVHRRTPVFSEHLEGLKALAQQTSTPIALGERLHSRWDVKRILDAGTVDIIPPGVCHIGGISEMRRIATINEAYDVAFAPHCPLGPIALAACVQVDARTAKFATEEMSLGIHYNAGTEDLTSYIKNPGLWNVTGGSIALLSALD